MANVLLLGAGRSVNAFVAYLKGYALELNLNFRVGDIHVEHARKISEIIPNSSYFQFDITSEKSLLQETKDADVVVSMLPAHLHGKVAMSCIETGTHLVTASYTNAQINQLHKTAKQKKLLILMECGLDPGIDHMSAMETINEIESKGGKIDLFKSFTGGLVAPESDNNPWNYKFTWNPRNVVLAGQGVVKFKRNNNLKYIPYSSLFKRVEPISVSGVGDFEAYANRDSLKYIDYYNLKDCPTVFRGTLRRPGFAKAWDFFVTLGLTDDSFTIVDSKGMTFRSFLNSFLVYHPSDTVEHKVSVLLDGDNDLYEKLDWLDFFSDEEVPLKNASPAQVLQYVLERKWKLNSSDKDMVVMQHVIEYLLEGKRYKETSSLVLKGDNAKSTSMAKTVGLPIGIAVRKILNGGITMRGVCVPTISEIYEPILEELETLGIVFQKEIKVMD